MCGWSPATAVWTGQCWASPWQNGSADRHRVDPVLYTDLESGLQWSW